MKKFVSLMLCVVLVCSLLTACGGSSKYDMAAAEAAPMEAPAAMNKGNSIMLTEESGSTMADPPENRKWIITVHMNAETDDLDTLTAALNEKIEAMNGYVEDQNIHNGSTYASRRYRSSNLTIRIPAGQVDAFTDEVSGISNVVSKSKSLEDVTLSYVATESRVKALQTEEARLLELLAKAENMADLLEIEARLTDVRYELENHASQLRLYDNQINYATIYLNIDEVQEYTPVDPSLWERITTGFSSSISGLGESLQDVLVFMIVAVPYVLVYGGILLVIAVPVKKLCKKCKARKAARKAAKLAAKDAEKKAE